MNLGLVKTVPLCDGPKDCPRQNIQGAVGSLCALLGTGGIFYVSAIEQHARKVFHEISGHIDIGK